MGNLFFKPIDKPEKNLKLEETVNNSIKKLQSIHTTIVVPPSSNIHDLIEKFKNIYDGGNTTLTKHEIYTLCFHCDELPNDNIRSFFIEKYIHQNWNTTLIKGLMFSILLKWHSEYTHKIIEALKIHYEEMRIEQKQAFSYLDSKEAPQRLVEQMRREKISPYKATYYVLLNESQFTFEYFEDIIRKHFEIGIINVEYVILAEECLEKHNSKRLGRIILPLIVLRSDKSPRNEEIERKIISTCVNRIGDINDEKKWQDNTLSPNEQVSLLKARHILLKWLLKRAIGIIFSRPTEKDRRSFWSGFHNKYSEKIERLYIISTDENTIKFCQNHNISSKKDYNDNNTVLIMEVDKYTLVELLDGGCLYVYYKNNNPLDKRQKAIVAWRKSSIKDIKAMNNDTQQLYKDDIKRLSINSNVFFSEFKIAHQGNWVDTFNTLFRKII